MLKHLAARPPLDTTEEHQVLKLAQSRHASADWNVPAQTVARSWDGRRTRQIAAALGCHMQPVRDRLRVFNVWGLEGMGQREHDLVAHAGYRQQALLAGSHRGIPLHLLGDGLFQMGQLALPRSEQALQARAHGRRRIGQRPKLFRAAAFALQPVGPLAAPT
jgi:hypothetical protein